MTPQAEARITNKGPTMDAFTYELAIKKIDTFTTFKAKDAFIRECWQEMTNGYSWYRIDIKKIDTIELLYKCITKTLQSYDQERLPEKIVRAINSTRHSLVKHYCSTQVLYSKFIDTFKYIDKLECDYMTYKDIKQLATIYIDNPLTFAIGYDMHLTFKFNSILGYDSVRSDSLSYLLQAESLKLELPSNTTYTIVEDILTNGYDAARGAKISANRTTSTIEAMQDLVTVSKTIDAKLNG